MIELAALAAILGGAWGLLADRLAVRWPEHEPGVEPRGLDWRTLAVVATGAAVGAALVLRWPEPLQLAVLGIYCLALLVLLATDLDQRLLPDLITLPLIGYTAVVLLLGWSPPLADDPNALLVALAAGLGGAAFLLLTDFLVKGALGLGDVKLIVSIGLLVGVSRLFAGFLAASVLISGLLVVLMVLGRLGRRSFIPFGPILIGAAFIAILLPGGAQV